MLHLLLIETASVSICHDNFIGRSCSSLISSCMPSIVRCTNERMNWSISCWARVSLSSRLHDSHKRRSLHTATAFQQSKGTFVDAGRFCNKLVVLPSLSSVVPLRLQSSRARTPDAVCLSPDASKSRAQNP